VKAIDHSEKVRFFQQSIVSYYLTGGRHDLPWRMTDNPWQMLLAEVLLRKTTSGQAAAVFEQVKTLTPEGMRTMDTTALAELLKPLGIHEVRAQQLKEIAAGVANADPELLKSDEFLRSFRGIGRYISNSVRCSAFGHSAPALDTNMIRVIQRVFGWKSERKRAREDKKLWTFAETLVPDGKCREFNWGVLDFGALICTHRSPRCTECLLSEICHYYQSTSPESQLKSN
jgi:A/G-specific adenine glycosylase